MDRDKLIRQRLVSGASWPVLVGIYIAIVATMILSAIAIT
jgi:hypothetical protein